MISECETFFHQKEAPSFRAELREGKPKMHTKTMPMAPGQKAGSSEKPTHEAVALSAYFLWQKRGCPQGECERDWYQAEAELRHPSRPEKTR